MARALELRRANSLSAVNPFKGPGVVRFFGWLMSRTILPAFDKAEALDVLASTRANYERFALLLLRVGHIPGLKLRHLDFRALVFLLAQKPGAYAAHQHTIAKACDSNTTSIRQSLARLRAVGIVLWELIPPHHVLPTGRFTRTNVNRYWVHLPRLAGLLEGVASVTSPKLSASTRPKSRASYGTEFPSERERLPPSPSPSSARARLGSGSKEEEASQSGSELGPILRAWCELRLGDVDHRSTRALENRRSEGATLEQLEAAVAGAGADEWLRRRAKVPFAVVFASIASIERFAHQGRKILNAKAPRQRLDGDERRKEPQVDEPRTQVPLSRSNSNFRELQLPPLFRPPAPLPTPGELAVRRAEQLSRLSAWVTEHGLES